MTELSNNKFGVLQNIGQIIKYNQIDETTFNLTVNIEAYFDRPQIKKISKSDFANLISHMFKEHEPLPTGSLLFNIDEIFNNTKRPFVRIRHINFENLNSVTFSVIKDTDDHVVFSKIMSNCQQNLRMYVNAITIGLMREGLLPAMDVSSISAFDFIYIGEPLLTGALIDPAGLTRTIKPELVRRTDVLFGIEQDKDGEMFFKFYTLNVSKDAAKWVWDGRWLSLKDALVCYPPNLFGWMGRDPSKDINAGSYE